MDTLRIKLDDLSIEEATLGGRGVEERGAGQVWGGGKGVDTVGGGGCGG